MENGVHIETKLFEMDVKDVSGIHLMNGNTNRETPITDSSSLIAGNSMIRVTRNVNRLTFFGPENTERSIIISNSEGNSLCSFYLYEENLFSTCHFNKFLSHIKF